MDAYDLQQKLRNFWGELSRIVSGSDIKKTFPAVPVYVIIDDELYAVNDASVKDGKIILKTDYTNE